MFKGTAGLVLGSSQFCSEVAASPLEKTLSLPPPPEAKLLAQWGPRFIQVLVSDWAWFTAGWAELKAGGVHPSNPRAHLGRQTAVKVKVLGGTIFPPIHMYLVLMVVGPIS